MAQGNAATAAAGDIHVSQLRISTEVSCPRTAWKEFTSGQEGGAQPGLMLMDKSRYSAPTAVQQPPSPLGPPALVSPPSLKHMDEQQEPHNVTAIGLGSADAAVEQQQEYSQLARESVGGGSSGEASHRHVALDTAAAFLSGMAPFGVAADDRSDDDEHDQAPSTILPSKGRKLSAEALTILDIVSSSSLNRDKKDCLLRALKSVNFRAEDIPWANAQQLYEYLEADDVSTSR